MKEELNQILREIVLCSMALGEYKDALSQVEEAIQLEPSVDNLWLKADVLYRDKEHTYSHGIYPMKVVDTTAAGDTFTGFFLGSIAKGEPADRALKLASAASSLAVSKKGAAISIPTIQEVTQYLLKNT